MKAISELTGKIGEIFHRFLQKRKGRISVKDRIFYSTALMVMMVIAVCMLIGACCVKVYWETEEKVLKQVFGGKMTSDAAEDLIEDLTVHNRVFNLMIVVFAVLGIVTFLIICRIFTVMLSKKIMKPLELMEQGAARVRENDLSTPVCYEGDLEFEQLAGAFNAMQQHLREEREQNARYEKARQEMIAGISHDLRSPLTAIRGSVKGILDGVVTGSEQQKKFLETAYRRSGEMDSLLSELFYFSKLETGGIIVQIQRLNLREYLENYFGARREQPGFSDMEFALFFPEDQVPYVCADPEALQRILDNILQNSRKYAKTVPLRFLVQVSGLDGYWQVVLQDNGVGVPEDKLGRIFEEFYRADESRNRKEGSGLGLYIVRYLARSMGGSVQADTCTRHQEFSGLAIILKLRAESRNDAASLLSLKAGF